MKVFPRKLLMLSALTVMMWGCTKNEEQVVDADAPKTAPELEALNWLVGDWVDDESGLDVSFTWKWDLNHRFLVEEFTVKDESETPLLGRQILGWDPLEKTIRSWIFDSDGGFGTSRWDNDENNWYAQTTFVPPTGEKASATYVYKKIDDDTFTFTSEIREVNGSILPDSGPYKFVRK